MKSKKNLALLLSLLMLASPLASCSKNQPSETDSMNGENVPEDSQTAEKPQLLTHIFRGNPISLPEEYYLSEQIAPLYDNETGSITCFCTYYYDVLDDEGNYVDYVNEDHLVTLASDGTVTEDKIIEIEGEDNVNVQTGVLSESSFTFLANSYDPDTMRESYFIVKYNLADGTYTKYDDINQLFSAAEDDWFYISGMTVDNDGYIYIATDQEVLVLDENCIRNFSVFSQNWIDSLTSSPNGTVYVSGYFEDGYGLRPIDKQTKDLGAVIQGLDSMNNIIFGEGYDFYYTDDQGLYGLTLADTDAGETENKTEIIMNFSNSDTTQYDIEILRIIDSETFIASEYDSQIGRQLSVYKKADDIDLSTVNVIEIATTHALQSNIPSMIVEYNKNNPDTRVIITDYSTYSNDENWNAGETKLATDIMNGLYKPDIIIDYPDSAVITEVVENDLYTDLYTFIDKDDVITRDDLFGSVKRTFDDDGKLWGLTSSFSVNTLIGTKAMLGDRESWTFSELLDFAAALPEGVELIEDMTQTDAAYTIFSGQGYGAFIDEETNTAHFDSPEFIKYLEFIKDLPSEINYEARPDDYWETRYLRYHNGEIALDSASIYSPGEWIGLETNFNTKDFTLIGYPTASEGEYGSIVEPDNAYIITQFTEYPEEAWDFIKSLCVPEYEEGLGYNGIYGFPILKSMYDNMIEEYYTYEYEFYFSGGAMWGSYDPENPTTDELQEPGIRTYFTEEDAARLKDFLDTKSGTSITENISDEITAIVDEDISAFTSGTRTAEAAADIIQSRVSIWLAEHE